MRGDPWALTVAGRFVPRKRPEKDTPRSTPTLLRVRPVQVKVGDRIVDETGEYEVLGRPYTSNAGKNVHVRVRRVDEADVPIARTWGARARVAVRSSGRGVAQKTRTRLWGGILSAVVVLAVIVTLRSTGQPRLATVAGLLAYGCILVALVWIVRTVVWRARN